MRTIRIFISSPGDVSEEREKARLVVDSLRRHFGSSVNLQVLMWEDLALDIDLSAQQSIEKELVPEDKVPDIAVFILWSRLGSELSEEKSPRPGGGSYRSGTEHEFELMLEARVKSGGARPYILAYWRQDEESFVDLLRREGPGRYEKLLEQKRLAKNFVEERFLDEKGRNVRGLVIYQKPVSFAERLHRHLQQKIGEWLGADGQATAQWKENPYRGLECFDQEHSSIFLGREEETHQIIELLREREQAGNAFVVVVGASGSGKSSLARAGVAATLSRGSFDEKVVEWRTIDFLPSTHEGELLQDFAASIAETVPELRHVAGGLDRFVDRLRGNREAAADLLASALGRASESAKGAVRLFLLVDQMEELWTDPRISEETREHFFEALRFLSLGGGVWILATLRADFYPEAQKSAGFLQLKGIGGHFDLSPPSPAALLRIITEPAKLAGAHFEIDPRSGRSLDQAILKDASSEAELLPLLQYALAELFEKRDTLKNELTFSAYQSMGGVDGALGRRIEELSADLPGNTLAALDGIFPLLVTLDATSGGSEARRRATLKELTATDEGRSVTEALVKARFLTTDEVNGEAVAGLAHEALLRCWNRLAEWIERNRALLRLRSTLEQSYSRWNQHDRDPSLLLGEGLAVEEGKCLLAEGGHLLSSDLSCFIRDSIHQIEKRAKRRSALRRQVIAGIGGALALGLVASTWQAVRATRAERGTEILERASRARVLAETSPVEALALALETAETEQQLKDGAISPAVMSSLLHTLESGRRLAQFGKPGEAVFDCFLSHDGRMIVYANHLRMTTVDRRSGLSRNSEPTRGATIRRLALSPDGQMVAIADDSGTITVVRTSGHEVIWRVKAHDGFATGLAWIPDSNLIASCGNDRRLRLWSIDGKEAAEAVELPIDSVGTFTVSPDGKKAAVAASEVHAGQGAWVIDLSSGEAKPLDTGDDFIRVLVFDSSGKQVAGAGVDRTIRVWDEEGSPMGIRIRTSHTASITALAFHPFEPWLISGAEDGGVHAYREDGEFHMPPLERHLGPVRSLGFDASGALGISGSRDGFIRIWDFLGLQARLPMHAGTLCRGLVFHSDGTRFAAGGMDGIVRFYSYPSGESLAGIRAHNNVCDQLLPLPADGGLLSASDEGNELQLLSWEGELVGEPWRPPGARFVAVSVFPDRPEFLILNGDGILFHGELPSFRILSRHEILSKTELTDNNHALAPFPEHRTLLCRGRSSLESRSLDMPVSVIRRFEDLRDSGNMRFRLAFPPSRDLLVTGGPKGVGRNRLDLHSLPSLDRVGELEVPWTNLTLAAFSRDGNELVMGSDTGEMQIFSRSGEALGPEIKAHAGELRGGALHPKEAVLATSGLDGYIRFWHFGREAWMEEARSRLGRGKMESIESAGLLQRAASRLLTAAPSDSSGRLSEDEIGISLVQPKEWVQFDRNALRMLQNLVVTTGGVTFQRLRIHRAFSRGESVRLGFLDVPNFYIVSTNEIGGIEDFASQVPRMMHRVKSMVSSKARALALADRLEFSDTVWDEELRNFRIEGVVERNGRDPILVSCWVIPTKDSLIAIGTAGDRVLLDQVGEIIRTLEVDPSVTPSEEEYARAGVWLSAAYEDNRKQEAIRLEAESLANRLKEDYPVAKAHAEAGRFDEALSLYRKNLQLVESLTNGPKAGGIENVRMIDLLFKHSEICRGMAEISIKTGDTHSAGPLLDQALHLFDRPGLSLSPDHRRSSERNLALLEDLMAKVKNSEGDLEGTLEWQHKAVERRRELARTNDFRDINEILDLMSDLLDLAGFQRSGGDGQGTLRTCEEAIQIGNGVDVSLRSESWLIRMRDFHAVIRTIHRDGKDREGEFEAMQRRVEIGEEWAKQHEAGRVVQWADAACRVELANLLLEWEKVAEAEKELKIVLGRIATLHPGETDAARIAGTAMSGLGTAQERLRKHRSETGLVVYMEIIKMRERLEVLRGLPEQLDLSAPIGWISFGGILFDYGKVAEVDAAFAKGISLAEASGKPALVFEVHHRLRAHFEMRADYTRADEHALKAWEIAREAGLGWQVVQGATGQINRLSRNKAFAEAEALALETWELAKADPWPDEPFRLRADLANTIRDLYRRWHLAQADETRAAAALAWAVTAFEHSPVDEKISDQNLYAALSDRVWRLATWVEEGKIVEYETELTRVLALSRGRQHLHLASMAARLVLLRPAEGDRLAEAVQMAKFSFDGTGGANAVFWNFITHTLALVRTGRAEEALALLDQREKGKSGDNPTALRLVRLLALNSLDGRDEEAKAVFTEIETDEGQKIYWNSPGEPYGAFIRVLLAEAKRGMK